MGIKRSNIVPPFPNSRRPLNIAHRGSMTLWPENTLYAYKRAIDLGADVLELDVHPSSDGQIVAIHDPTVDRTSDGSGRVDQMNLKELKALDFTCKFIKKDDDDYLLRRESIHIPTLEEIFNCLPNSYFIIDIKPASKDFTLRVIELIRKKEMFENVVLASFHNNVADVIKDNALEISTVAGKKDVRRMFVLNKICMGFINRTAADVYMVPACRKGREIASKSFIQAVHDLGKEIYVWTIDNPEKMRSLIKSGIDGIITNRSDILCDVLKELKD